jgi:hypothetical protein
VSEKQLEANRRNALRSTGPKTAEGVEAAKFNSFRHGLRSIQILDPDLTAVIDARDRLPTAVRAGIVAMVRDAGGGR